MCELSAEDLAEFSAVMKSLGLADIPQSWCENWAPSMHFYTGQDMEFLQDNYISEANKVFKLSSDKLSAFYRALAIIRSHKELRRLVWLWHYILFSGKVELAPEEAALWPCPLRSMGSLAGMFHAIVLVSGFEHIKKVYAEKNIPNDIFTDTMTDLGICMDEYHVMFGEYGIGSYRIGWLLNHFTGRLFRLGRLQFIRKKLEGYIEVFQNNEDSKLTVLCKPGVQFRRDGLIEGTNGIFDDGSALISVLVEEEDFVEGNPVLPSGRISDKLIRLSKKVWHPVLQNGDTVLDVHISRDGKMTYVLCRESYLLAKEFYLKYFPDSPIKAFICTSWLLDSQLASLLTETANIVRFQKDFNLFPVKSNEDDFFEYVFESKPVDIVTLPERTSLQKVIKKYMLKGNHMKCAGGFFLADDIRKA